MQQNIRRRLEHLRDYKCECSRNCWRTTLKQNVFVIILVSSVAFGIILGAALRQKATPWTELELVYLRFPGNMFLRMLKMIMLPLIIASVISGTSNLNHHSAGKIGGRAVLYYMTTMFISVSIGIILVVSIQPGHHGRVTKNEEQRKVSPGLSVLDLIRDCFPDNIFAAPIEKTVTEIRPVVTTSAPFTNSSNTSATETLVVQYVPAVTKTPGTNILGIIVFSIMFSIAVNSLKENGRVVHQFFDAVNGAMHKLVGIIIWYTPIGIIFLISSKVVEMNDPYMALTQLGLFIVTVTVGLVIHFFIILPAIYFFFVRKNPYKFLFGMSEAIMIALATASSSATMSVTLRCAIEKNKIDRRISQFVISVGTSVNMDGTALYEAVASIFIAQMNGVALNFGNIIIISLTSIVAAIGAAGIPEAGLVTILIVLEAVGLPTDDLELILAIDWFLDRLRTSTNVWGDAIGAAIVERLSRHDLNAQGDMNGGNFNPGYVDQDVNINAIDIEQVDDNREGDIRV